MRTNKQKRRKTLEGVAFVAPGVLGFGVFYIYAVLLCGYTSFSTSMGEWSFAGFDNYKSLFASSTFRLALKNTGLFLAVGLPLLLVLGLAIAFGMNYIIKKVSPRWSDAIFTSYLLPMVISCAPVLLVLQMLFSNEGLINSLLVKFGWEAQAFLNSEATFWVLMVVFLWRNIGYCIILLTAGAAAVPQVVIEASQIDGAGHFTRVFKIYLPNMKNVILFAVIMGATGVFKIYRDSYFLLGEYPTDSAYMIQNFLNNNYYSLNFIRLSSAGLVFVIGLSLILAAVLYFWEREKVKR